MPGEIKNQVVGTPILGEVLPRVINNLVRAERAHERQLLRVVYPGDLGSIQLGQLHGVHARAAAGTIDQHLLPGLDPMPLSQS